MNKRRLFGGLVACALLAVFYFAHRADQANRRHAPSSVSATTSMIGTWQIDGGATIDLRGDGTGRSRDPQDPQSGITYFEWETDGKTLKISWSPRGKFARFIAHWSSVETAVFDLEEVSEDVFTLSENPSNPNRLERSEDAVLQQAP